MLILVRRNMFTPASMTKINVPWSYRRTLPWTLDPHGNSEIPHCPLPSRLWRRLWRWGTGGGEGWDGDMDTATPMPFPKLLSHCWACLGRESFPWWWSNANSLSTSSPNQNMQMKLISLTGLPLTRRFNTIGLWSKNLKVSTESSSGPEPSLLCWLRADEAQQSEGPASKCGEWNGATETQSPPHSQGERQACNPHPLLPVLRSLSPVALSLSQILSAQPSSCQASPLSF